MLRAAAVDGSLYGLSIYSRGPKLSHLFFGDKSLMYCEATMEDCTKIWKISWHNINKQQDKKVNLNKSTIYFSKSCDDGTKEALKNFLGVTLSWEDDKYLGLPLVTHSLNGKPFNTLRSEFGKGFKVGRVSSYLKLARESSVAQVCWPMLWASINSLKSFVLN